MAEVKTKKPVSESSVLGRGMTKALALRAVVDELSDDPVAFGRVADYIATVHGVAIVPIQKPKPERE